jgi:hypothetical protein
LHHLGGSTLKQTTTTSGKQSITTKEIARFGRRLRWKVVGNVGAGVTGNEENLGGMIAKGNPIACLQKDLLSRNATSIFYTPINNGLGKLFEQLGIATYVITVMVSIQNSSQISL